MGKAFFDYMQKVPKEVAEKVTKSIDHGVKAIEDGSQAAYEEMSKEISEIWQQTNQETWDATRDELKDRVMRNLRELGESTEDAEKFAESRVKELWDKAEKLRKMSKPAKLLWLKAVAAGTAALGLLVFAISSGFHSGANLRIGMRNLASRIESSQLNMQLRMEQEEFDNMMRGIQHPPSVALPMAVAAIETTPVTATIIPSSGNSYAVQTTIGNVYRSVPESRHEIESGVVSAPHPYSFFIQRSGQSRDVS